MSDTIFDYPPTFVEHRPANYGSIAHKSRLQLGKLRHYFFASRLSCALRMVLDPNKQVTTYHRYGFRAAIEHVLISHGYCATFGIEVPAPYYLQNLAADWYPDTNVFFDKSVVIMNEGLRAALSSDEERNPDGHKWAEAMTDGVGCWWRYTDGDVSTLPSFFDLDSMFNVKLHKLAQEEFISEKSKLTEGDIVFILDLNPPDAYTYGASPATKPADDPMVAPLTDKPTDDPMVAPPTDRSTDDPMLAPPTDKPTDVPRLPAPIQGLPHKLLTVHRADEIPASKAITPGLKNATLSNIRDRIMNVEQRIQMLQNHEAEIVERRSYNVDLCSCLHKLSNRLKNIPFRSSGVEPQTGTSKKGKERELQSEGSHAHFEGGWTSRVMEGMDVDDLEANRVPLDPFPMPEWVVRFDDLFAEVLPGLYGPAADNHQCTYRLLLTDLLRDQFQQLSIEDAIVALQDLNSDLDVPDTVKRYRDLEDRPPPRNVAASILDPAMHFEERARLLEVFTQCATHLTPESPAIGCGRISPDRHPNADTVPANGLPVVVSSFKPPTYATVSIQTLQIADSIHNESNPPSDPESDNSDDSAMDDDSADSDDIQYDDEAGYGVSTELP